MTTRRIVLDANILVRAVLGDKVRKLITAYADEVDFGAPEIAFLDAAEHLPHIAADRDVDPGPWLDSLNALKDLVAVLTIDQAEHLLRRHCAESATGTPTTGRSSQPRSP